MVTEHRHGYRGIGKEIVDSAIRVHTHVGPGMLESAYEACIAHELGKRSLAVRRQVPLPLRYDDLERVPAWLERALARPAVQRGLTIPGRTP